jgi:hypothetical protein
MSDVALFFLRPWLGAGSTTFTAHLYKALQLRGHSPSIYRVVDADEHFGKPFGAFPGVTYQCVSAQTARGIVKATPSLITAVTKAPIVRDGVVDNLASLGARAVVHDSTEVKNYDWSKIARPICVRQAVTQLLPGSVYLPHPYVRQAARPDARQRLGAVSVARVAPSKRTDIVLQANRLLPKLRRVRLLGMESGGYAKTLAATYKDVFSRARPAHRFPLDFASAPRLCAWAAFNVDMSWFAQDGGGTQYAMLEAMDAGAVNVMHKDWFRFGGDVKEGVHALSVDGAAGLASLLKASSYAPGAVRKSAYALLDAHGPAVADAWLTELLSK